MYGSLGHGRNEAHSSTRRPRLLPPSFTAGFPSPGLLFYSIRRAGGFAFVTPKTHSSPSSGGVADEEGAHDASNARYTLAVALRTAETEKLRRGFQLKGRAAVDWGRVEVSVLSHYAGTRARIHLFG